jgi:hypothetical protein
LFSHLYKPVFAKLLFTLKEETGVILMYDDYHVYLDKAEIMLAEGYLSRCSRICGKIIVGLIITLTQHRKVSLICALFKAYTGEQAWKATGDRLEKPCYLSRVDHNRKIRSRKQKTDI